MPDGAGLLCHGRASARRRRAGPAVVVSRCAAPPQVLKPLATRYAFAYRPKMITGLEATQYQVRRATRADETQIAELYTGLSQRSMHTRFSAAMSLNALAQAALLSNDAIAVIACRGSEVVGEARYSLWEGTPEFALTVADLHQGRGVGKLVLEHLRDLAHEQDVTVLRAVIQSDNLPMLLMVQRLGVAVVTPPDDGETIGDIASDDYMPGWGPDTGRKRVLIESHDGVSAGDADALRAAGVELRVCLGPGRGRSDCPLLVHGRCRLAEEAELIVSALLAEVQPSAEIGQEHVRRRPDTVVVTSPSGWREAVSEMIAVGNAVEILGLPVTGSTRPPRAAS